MSTSTPCDPKSPLMVAWTAYKATEEYRQSFKWGEYEQHRDGALWAAFEQGFRRSIDAQPPAASPSPQAWRPISEAPKHGVIWLRVAPPCAPPFVIRGRWDSSFSRNEGAWVGFNTGSRVGFATHWQPDTQPSPDLPAPGEKETMP